jgi:hypothetical protein
MNKMSKMKKYALLFGLIMSLLLTWFSLGWAQCPEDPRDSGDCDSLCLQIWLQDSTFIFPGPQFVRVPAYVVHDLPNQNIDSIAAFVIPLCFTHNNPAKYCSLTSYWNSILTSVPNHNRNIFRHMPDNNTPIVHNWMWDLYESGSGGEWNGVILDLDGTTHFQLVLVPSGSEDPLYGEITKRLLFTMTFKLTDTMTVCIDSCFWPPSDRLCFSRSDAVTYIPRHNLPFCFSVSCPVRGNTTGGLDGDCRIDVGDIIFLISYLYKDGHPLDPLERGDTDCNGVVDIGDVIYLINYLFKSGPVPSC